MSIIRRVVTADFLTTILEVLARAASATSPRDSLDAATVAYRHLVRFDGSALLLPEPKPYASHQRGYALWMSGATGPPDRLHADSALARPTTWDEALVLLRDELDCEASRDVLVAHGHAAALALPLRVQGRPIGSLVLFADDAGAFTGIDPAPLLAGASIVAVAIEHARDRMVLERLAEELGLARRHPGDPWIIRDARPDRRARAERGRHSDLRPLADIERDAIARVLAHTRGRVSGPRGAAAILRMKPTTLASRMKKLGVPRKA
jgi:transcriptional regulator with GAF, ATPase, and Fis domain